MIITKKTVSRGGRARSSRGHVIAAIDYIFRDADGGRVGDVWMSPDLQDQNLSNDQIKTLMKSVMIATNEENGRTKDPVRHYILTWRENERLDHENMGKVINRLLRCVGVQDHDWVAVRHIDKEGQHLHLIVNSINPQTFKSGDFHQDIKKMMQEVARINHQLGWDVRNQDAPEYQNARYRIGENGEIEDQREARDQAMPTEAARAKERHGQEASMETYLNAVREELFPKKDSLKGLTWQDFHNALAAHGLSYETKGSGAIWKWTHQNEHGEPQTETRKASVIPSFSLAKMTKLLGPYQPPECQEKTITGRIASPTNPATTDRAQKDLAQVQEAAAQTRKGVQKRQLIKSVLEYRHSTQFRKMHTTGTVAQKQIRAWENIQRAKQEAERRRVQEEAARARAEMLKRHEAAEAERRKKAEREAEETRIREQERIQKEKEEARQREIERQRQEQARELEIQRKEAEEARRVEEEKQRQKEKTTAPEEDDMSEETRRSLDASRLRMMQQRFWNIYQRHTTEGPERAVDHALRATWEMEWKSPQEAQEYTARWLSELGFRDTKEGREYIAYWGAGGPAHQEAMSQARGPQKEPEEEYGPAR